MFVSGCMDKKITLDTLDCVESLHKSDFYQLITGMEPPYTFGSTQVEFDSKKNVLREENMGKIMTAVEKLEKRYEGVGYYTGPVERIRDAYTQKDFRMFYQEILELLVNINFD